MKPQCPVLKWIAIAVGLTLFFAFIFVLNPQENGVHPLDQLQVAAPAEEWFTQAI